MFLSMADNEPLICVVLERVCGPGLGRGKDKIFFKRKRVFIKSFKRILMYLGKEPAVFDEI